MEEMSSQQVHCAAALCQLEKLHHVSHYQKKIENLSDAPINIRPNNAMDGTARLGHTVGVPLHNVCNLPFTASPNINMT